MRYRNRQLLLLILFFFGCQKSVEINASGEWDEGAKEAKKPPMLVGNSWGIQVFEDQQMVRTIEGEKLSLLDKDKKDMDLQHVFFKIYQDHGEQKTSLISGESRPFFGHLPIDLTILVDKASYISTYSFWKMDHVRIFFLQNDMILSTQNLLWDDSIKIFESNDDIETSSLWTKEGLELKGKNLSIDYNEKVFKMKEVQVSWTED